MTMPSQSAAAPRSAAGWPAVLVVYAAALLLGMTLVSFPATSAVLKEALALSDADYGVIFLPQVALAIIGAVAGGTLAHRLGLAALLTLALAANAASQVFLAATDFVSPASGFVLLNVATACSGLGFGLMGAPANVYPRLLFPARGETAIVVAHTLIGLGLAVGPLIAGVFVGLGAWYAFAVVLAAVCVLNALAVLIVRLPQAEMPESDGKEGAVRPATTLRFWLFATIAVLYALAEGTFSNWAVIFLRDSKGLSDIIAGYALSAFWGALVAGRLLVSVLIVRVPARVIWLALLVLMIAACWLIPLTDSAVTGIGAFALAGLACSAFLPLTISLAIDRFPDSVAWVSSMLIAALMTGIGIGSWVFGLLQAMFPLEALYRLSSLYPLMALLLAALVLSTSRGGKEKRAEARIHPA